MTFRALGLGALLATALRGLAGDDGEQAQIAAVREKMDALTGELSSIKASLAANDALDATQAEALDGITAELGDLATVLTGPRDDPGDNGVIAEVEPVDPGATSPAADAVVEQQTAAVEAQAGAAETEEVQEEREGE